MRTLKLNRSNDEGKTWSRLLRESGPFDPKKQSTPSALPPHRLALIAPRLQLSKVRSNRATKRINATDRQRSSENKWTSRADVGKYSGGWGGVGKQIGGAEGTERMGKQKGKEKERKPVHDCAIVNGLNGRSRG